MVYGMSPDPKTQINKGLPFRSGTAGVNIPTIGSDFANVPIKQPGLQPKVTPTTTPVMQSTAKPQTQPSQAQTTTKTPTSIPVSDISGVAGVNKPVVGSQFNKPTGAEQTQVSNWSTETKGRMLEDMKPKEEISVDIDKSLSDLSADMTNVINEGRTPDIIKLKTLYPEFAQVEDSVLEDLTADIGRVVKEGREIDMDRLKELYPELSGGKIESEGNAVGQAIKDVVGGAYDSATGLPRFIAENLSKGIGWIAKELGADQDKVDKLVGGYISSLGDFSGEAMGAKKENLIYKGTKLVGDLAQIANPAGLGKLGIKAGATAGKIAKEGSLMSKVANVATQGVVDTAVFMPQSEQRMATPGELALGGAIGGAIPVAGAGLNLLKKGIQKIAPKLELSGLLNPAKLNQVKNQLIDEGTEMIGKGTNEDVGKWMIERGIKGNKQQIIEQLGNNAKKSKGMVDDLLASSKSVHDIPSARKALENIGKEVGDVPGLEAKANKIQELMNKPTHTLTELNQIKRELDDVYNLYTKAGGESAGLKAEGLRNIRQQIRKYIEDVATEEGLGNIKMLNNETSIAKTLEDAIGRKDSADMAREMLSIFSKGTVGGAIGTQAGPFNNDTIEGKIGNFLVGSILGTALLSTTSKTYVANAMRKLSGLEKKELSRFIATKGKQTVSTATLNKLSDIKDGLKALPSPETVSKSNIGTAKNPIVGKGVPKKDIVEIPLSSKPKNASSNPISNTVLPSKENAGLKTVAPVKSEALPVKSEGIDVGITSVKGFKDQKIDLLVDEAKRLESKGDIVKAQEYYSKSIQRGQDILKQEFGDNVLSSEGTVGRYFGESEPTIALKLKNITDADIDKLMDLSENKFKQKSFFVAEPTKALTPGTREKYGIIDKKLGLSNEPGVIIYTKNKVGLANVKELDIIMNEIGLPGATILPNGAGIKIYNLSAFNTDYGKFLKQVSDLKQNPGFNKSFGVSGSPESGVFKVRHLGINEGEGLGTYTDRRGSRSVPSNRTVNKNSGLIPKIEGDPHRSYFIDKISKIKASEQRIGKVGNKKVGIEYKDKQSRAREKAKEQIIREIQEKYNIEDTNAAYDMYDDFSNASYKEIESASKIKSKGITVKKKAPLQEKITQPVVRVKAPESQIKNIKGDINIKSDGSVEVKYIRNTEKSPNVGDKFLQSSEPKGQYFNISEGGNVPQGRESGTKTFKNPLVIERKSSGKGGRKEDLSNMYGGKKGQALTDAVKKDGYDGIITYNEVRGEKYAQESVDLLSTKTKGLPTKSKGLGKK